MRVSTRWFVIAAGTMWTGEALSQQTTRVSVNASGSQLSVESSGSTITADGRFVLFLTSAGDVVSGDTNGVTDLFIRDLANQTTERASVGSGGVEADGMTRSYGVSADGRFVVFESEADNLVPGDLNAINDIFVRDRQLGTTERVSVVSDGSEADSSSFTCSISADGRYVTFASDADNLVAGDTNGFADVFRHDRQTGSTIRVNLASGGAQSNHASFDSSVSGDGRFVVFRSWATNLGPLDQNGTFGYDVFVHDCTTGATEGVSVAPDGSGGDGDSEASRISEDGRFVIFKTYAYNLLPQSGASRGQVLLRDLQAHTTTPISLTPMGALAQYDNHGPAISPGGRYVAFDGAAWDYAATGGFYHSDVFLRDCLLGIVVPVSVDPNWGLGDGASGGATVSADGSRVAFVSDSTTLVPGDTNGVLDVFVRDLGLASIASFCSGDGTGSSCPCANAGVPFHGCQNSASTGGAVLWATGTSRIGEDTLRITSSGMRVSALTVLMQGDASIAAVNYGDGLRCIAGGLKRICARSAQRGIMTYPQGTDASISVRSAAVGDPIAAGETRYYQSLYRDPAVSFCPSPTGNTFNASDAISTVWDP